MKQNCYYATLHFPQATWRPGALALSPCDRETNAMSRRRHVARFLPTAALRPGDFVFRPLQPIHHAMNTVSRQLFAEVDNQRQL
jgi:hypothetical protein